MDASHLRLADEFYLAAQHPITFKPRLAEPRLFLGLSAALLGEQLLFGGINIRGYKVIVKPPAEDNNYLANLDPLSRYVYQTLGTQRHPTSVQQWVEILSTRSHDWVVQRMTQQGLLTITEQWQWRRFRTVRAHVPTDPLRAGAGVSRVAGQLSRMKTLPPDDAVLVGLMDVGGLRQYVLDETVPDQQGADQQGVIRVRMERLPTRELPADFEELFKALKDAADSILLTGLA